MTNKPYFEGNSAEIAANTMICLIHQTNYLLDQQLRALEKEFLKEGGFTEKLYRRFGESETLEPMVTSTVTSLTLGGIGREMQVELENLGQVDFSQVNQIL